MHSEREPTGVDAAPVTKCNRCGGTYRFDISIPSEMWNPVIRPNGEVPDMLCAYCIIAAFVRAGVGFSATLWGEDFKGEPIIVLTPQPCAHGSNEVTP